MTTSPAELVAGGGRQRMRPDQRRDEHARDGAISGGTAYELHELHQVLFNTEIPPDAKAKEAIRIVERKRESGSDQQVNEQVKASFAGWIQTISLDELAREMIVAKELAGIEGEAQ